MKNTLLTQRIALIILCAVMAILLLGCFPQAEGDTRSSITTSPRIQISASPTLENTATATALPTRKPTATFPPTRTPLPPQTDLPTIIPGSINTMIDSLYTMCELPCWGGVIPGKTSQYAAKRYLAPLGEWYAGGESLGEVSFQYKNTSASIYLLLEHGLVDSIQLPPALTRLYRINRLFTEYGAPEDVQLEILPLTADLTTWYRLALLYPRQGFFAVFEAKGTVINSIIHICPRNISPDLFLFSENRYSLSQTMEILLAERPNIYFQPLNKLTQTDTKQFYEIFSKQNVGCMATNVKFQLP